MADLSIQPVRQPRFLIQVGGVTMTGCESWQVDNNTHYQADTFRAKFRTSALPPANGPAWWSIQGTLTVEIFVGFPANPAPGQFSAADLTSIFYGKIDEEEWDAGEWFIEISGRDLTGEMIDTKTSDKYANLTSSQIVAQIAAAHGLQTQIAPTTTKVGRYYQIDRVRLQTERTEWDLITWLAREEGYQVFIKGKTLYFQPAGTSGVTRNFVWTPAAAPGLTPHFPGTSLKFGRNRTLARDITVEVRSWNQKQKKGFTKTAKATRQKSSVLKQSSPPVYDAQTYSYAIPNLTAEQAQARANQILAELSAHELKCYIDGPADNDLSVDDTIQISGTGTAYDQSYFPDSIVRYMGMDGNYRWSITSKNHPPESEPAI